MEGRLRQTVRVPASAAGTSLLDYLCARFRYHDRATWAAKIEVGEVELDGARVRAGTVLRRGAVVSYERAHREPDVPLAVPVIADGDGWIAVDKPAGLPVHADGAFVLHTLTHQLQLQRGGIVQPAHRLDRETSGVLLVVTDRARAGELQTLFAERRVTKVYQAIVHGWMTADAQCIELPIGRAPTSEIAIRRAIVADGQTARTDLRVLQRHGAPGADDACTLVEAVPHTGRTHQIRVHLEALGHPVVGDLLYGRPDADYLRWLRHVKAGHAPSWREGRPVDHHLLHSARLTFADHEETRTVEAPLPTAMRAYLEARR
jgi:23S rRNA pseudouridine1911/1915/1917 synthase